LRVRPGANGTSVVAEVARRWEGVDVVIGVVETHGRAETAALLMCGVEESVTA
jgi:K+-sensing histidine kinase KdpD